MNANLRKFLLLTCLALLPVSELPAQEDIEVIVVSGRRPGPPLWKVTNGDNTLWILPLVSTVPKDMEWDDKRIADLIAAADAALDEPNVTFDLPNGVWMNPFNAVRAVRLWGRLQKRPDGAQLVEVLPPDIYARYSVFKTAYFPRDRDIDAMRPAFAIPAVFKQVFDTERLTGVQDIRRKVERHLRRNRELVRTDPTIFQKVDGSFGELRERAERMTDSLQTVREIACFDQQLGVLEQHLDDIKIVANAWADGSASALEEFREAAAFEACNELLLDSTEGDLMLRLEIESRQRWLDAAEAALETHRSTFAMLPLDAVIGTEALVAELGARGYMIHDPR